MSAIIDLLRHLRLEGHGSSNLAKGLGLIFRAMEKQNDIGKKSVGNRLFRLLLKIFSKNR